MKAAVAQQLRQEHETFEQAKAHAAWWFTLRVVMGYTVIVLIGLVAGVCAYVILRHDQFDASTLRAAITVLGVDILGLVAAGWKMILAPASAIVLAPVTRPKSPPDE